ncbi:MAG: hypothetical protein SVY53_00245 [Chloroflexota bacterium]|nr:hypothetical protein [Chloroflexota bacterium]
MNLDIANKMKYQYSMAWPLRIEFDGAIYHITSRSNELKPIYKDDEHRTMFLDIVKEVEANVSQRKIDSSIR